MKIIQWDLKIWRILKGKQLEFFFKVYFRNFQLHAWVCAGASKSPQSQSQWISLELEVQAFVSSLTAGAGNQTRVLEKQSVMLTTKRSTQSLENTLLIL